MSDANRQLNILWLWPDILNLHGDRGNVMALVRVCGLYGIEAGVTRVTRLADDFDPALADIAVLNAGELAVMPQVIGALAKRFTDLKAWIETGGVLFATGTTGAVLGAQTRRIDGSYIFGTGLLGMECVERKEALGDDLIFRLPNDMTVYGTQIQMMDIALTAGQQPLGETVYGYGNNGEKAEGAVQDNVIFTNALGPVLVKNPWLTLELINRALKRRDGGDSADPEPLVFDPDLFGLELASAEAIKLFNEKKEKPK